MVDTAEDDVAGDASEEDHSCLKVRPDHGIASEVLRLKGVNRGKPHDTPPSKIESKMIMTNVNRAEIPIFVDEKVHDIDCVEESCYEDRLGNVAMNLVLPGDE